MPTRTRNAEWDWGSWAGPSQGSQVLGAGLLSAQVVRPSHTDGWTLGGSFPHRPPRMLGRGPAALGVHWPPFPPDLHLRFLSCLRVQLKGGRGLLHRAGVHYPVFTSIHAGQGCRVSLESSLRSYRRASLRPTS